MQLKKVSTATSLILIISGSRASWSQYDTENRRECTLELVEPEQQDTPTKQSLQVIDAPGANPSNGRPWTSPSHAGVWMQAWDAIGNREPITSSLWFDSALSHEDEDTTNGQGRYRPHNRWSTVDLRGRIVEWVKGAGLAFLRQYLSATPIISPALENNLPIYLLGLSILWLGLLTCWIMRGRGSPPSSVTVNNVIHNSSGSTSNAEKAVPSDEARGRSQDPPVSIDETTTVYEKITTYKVSKRVL